MLLIMEPMLFIMEFMLFMMEVRIPGSMAGAEDELELRDDELLLDEDLEEDTDDALEEALDDAAADDFTTGLLMMRASVVQRPGTMLSSSEVQCSMPEQSLGE